MLIKPILKQMSIIIIISISIACENERDDVLETISTIESRLGMERSSEEMPISNRLDKIKNRLNSTELEVFVFPHKDNDFRVNGNYSASIFVRKRSLLGEQNAVVFANDSVYRAEYDSTRDLNSINIPIQKSGLNECSGFITFNRSQDTVKFLCDFKAKQKLNVY